MGSLDAGLFDWINHWPQSLHDFLKFFSVALSLPIVKVGFGILLIAMLLRNPTTRKAALLAMVAVGIANTLTNVAKEAFPMNRPFQDRAYVKVADNQREVPADRILLRVGYSDSKGTASAHSANMAALALVMVYFLRKWGTPWIAVALLTGISRIYTGAHYPSQVMLGWLCGLFAAFVVIKTWEAWTRMRNPVQSESDEPPELA
ncbi:MAG TPA: phosphatase PAP2 family protein [Fimbriimonadaceae bacterium]|nr:phosphatase PAP2 family protein [Fimbriimonadaceae bacterium]